MFILNKTQAKKIIIILTIGHSSGKDRHAPHKS